MKLTSLDIPRYNETLGMYECEVCTTGEQPYMLYDTTLEGLQEKKVQLITRSLNIARKVYEEIFTDGSST